MKNVKAVGVITYVSEKAKLQNGFGAWKHITLYFDYDARAKKVIQYDADVPDQ